MTDSVFLVEDDPDIRQDLAFLIEHQGYRVETATNGKDALAKLPTIEKPSIIILDLMMPVMDGWQLRLELLKKPQWADIPVVLLSGVGDIQAEVRSLRAADYLRKPVDLKKLYRVLALHCKPGDPPPEQT